MSGERTPERGRGPFTPPPRAISGVPPENRVRRDQTPYAGRCGTLVLPRNSTPPGEQGSAAGATHVFLLSYRSRTAENYELVRVSYRRFQRLGFDAGRLRQVEDWNDT